MKQAALQSQNGMANKAKSQPSQPAKTGESDTSPTRAAVGVQRSANRGPVEIGAGMVGKGSTAPVEVGIR